MRVSKPKRNSALPSCVFLPMALYSSEHILKERSQEWESCVEWDTRGALSMGTLFLAMDWPASRCLLPLTIELSPLTTKSACRYLFC